MRPLVRLSPRHSFTPRALQARNNSYSYGASSVAAMAAIPPAAPASDTARAIWRRSAWLRTFVLGLLLFLVAVLFRSVWQPTNWPLRPSAGAYWATLGLGCASLTAISAVRYRPASRGEWPAPTGVAAAETAVVAMSVLLVASIALLSPPSDGYRLAAAAVVVLAAPIAGAAAAARYTRRHPPDRYLLRRKAAP